MQFSKIVVSLHHNNKQIEIMATLTNQFLREQKVNGNFQRVVLYCGTEHAIDNITDKNIIVGWMPLPTVPEFNSL